MLLLQRLVVGLRLQLVPVHSLLWPSVSCRWLVLVLQQQEVLAMLVGRHSRRHQPGCLTPLCRHCSVVSVQAEGAEGALVLLPLLELLVVGWAMQLQVAARDRLLEEVHQQQQQVAVLVVVV